MRPARKAFSLIELLAVIAIIAILLFLLLPAVHQAGHDSRRMTCRNNLKGFALAFLNYHDAYSSFPAPLDGNGVSGLVPLLPMMEQEPLYNEIVRTGGLSPGGPTPWDKTYAPWQTWIEMFMCPSATSDVEDYRPVNYAFCIGDITQNIHQLPTPRGAFAPGHYNTLRQISETDNTSSTVMMAEIGTPHGRSLPGQYVIDLPDNILSDPGICYRVVDSSKKYYDKRIPLDRNGRGYNWVDGRAGPALVNTILPPNSPSCAVGGSVAVDGIYSAGSYHVGGCHVVFVDGSVHFISETIDAGDPSSQPLIWKNKKPEPSPFGVWGAIGSISGGETFKEDYPITQGQP